jgi:hypothetical protein
LSQLRPITILANVFCRHNDVRTLSEAKLRWSRTLHSRHFRVCKDHAAEWDLLKVKNPGLFTI